jgi:DNA-binding NtrC family response regulator
MSTNNKRVLVVDDEVNVADTLVLILQVFGFEAIAAYSGQDAVTTAQQFKPDAAILEVVMEHLSGIDAGVLISEMVSEVQCRSLLGTKQSRRNASACQCRWIQFPHLRQASSPPALPRLSEGPALRSSAQREARLSAKLD